MKHTKECIEHCKGENCTCLGCSQSEQSLEYQAGFSSGRVEGWKSRQGEVEAAEDAMLAAENIAAMAANDREEFRQQLIAVQLNRIGLRTAVDFALGCVEGTKRDYAGELIGMLQIAADMDDGITHASDCGLHDRPAYTIRPCNCDRRPKTL